MKNGDRYMFGCAKGVYTEPFIGMAVSLLQFSEFGSLVEALKVSDLYLVPYAACFGF